MVKPCLVICVVLCLAGCHDHPSGDHDHAAADAAHEHAHAAPADDHPHDGPADHAHEPEAVQISVWQAGIELFIEHTPFVAGAPTRFVTHVTHLDGWRPRTSGPVTFVLTAPGKTSVTVEDPAPARDGIYIPTLTFPAPGTWQIEVRVPEGDTVARLMLDDITVYGSAEEAAHAAAPEEAGDDIAFLKEQQWRMPFASEEVRDVAFRAALPVNGEITPRAGGEVVVTAPMDGRIPATDTPAHLGSRVEKGRKLVSLIPRLPDDDPAALDLAVQRAEPAHAFAAQELARLRGLFAQEAVPENRVRAAELAEAQAAADLAAARTRKAQFDALQKEHGDTTGRVAVYAPISGTVIEADVVPGAAATAGERLFHLIDLDTVWLTLHVPEADIGRVTAADGAWFEVEGLARVFEVGGESGGRRVALGGRVDPTRRTVPLIFEMPNPDHMLRIGMFVHASVLTGETAQGPALPLSALLDEGGQAVAYVQTGGESFARRVLQLGIRDGDRVQVLSGLAPGERVVTQGAYQLRLAASSNTLPAHGHAH